MIKQFVLIVSIACIMVGCIQGGPIKIELPEVKIGDSKVKLPELEVGGLPNGTPTDSSSDSSSGSSESSTVKISPQDPSWDRPTLDTVTDGTINIELKDCKRSGRTLSCYLVVTNEGQDGRFSISGSTKVFDDGGNEYVITYAQLADKGEHLESYSRIEKMLISGIPVKAKMIFGGFSPQSSKISLLYMTDVIKFRDIILNSQ